MTKSNLGNIERSLLSVTSKLCDINAALSQPSSILMKDNFDSSSDYSSFTLGPALSTQSTGTNTDTPVIMHVHDSAFLEDIITYTSVINTDSALDINSLPSNGGLGLDTDRYMSTNDAGPSTIKVDFSRPFTGQIHIRVAGDGVNFDPGATISNISEEYMYSLSSFIDNGDFTYTHSVRFVDGIIVFTGIDISTFLFDIEFLGSTTAGTAFAIQLVETSQNFIRTFQTIGGVLTPVDYLPDGTPYTVRGVASVIGEDSGETKPDTDGLIGVDSNPNGGSVEGVGLISGGTDSVTTGTIAYSDNTRRINVIVKENVKVTIDVTLHGGATYQHIMYGGSYQHEIPLNQPPVDTVVVTNTELTASDVVINYSSKTRF